MQSYHTTRDGPLTPEEVKEKYEETLEEMKEVEVWKKEEETKLKKDNFKTPQAKSANKRNLYKANKRVDQVKGMIEYWKNRMNGMSHFRASIELNEYWATLKEASEKKKEEAKRLKQEEADKLAEEKLAKRLKKK
ncbi:hypothetical protein HOD29_03285 [archaeon]|jgi:hypothetical protein|nr:hypothetical protein [archaeon]